MEKALIIWKRALWGGGDIPLFNFVSFSLIAAQNIKENFQLFYY